MKVVVTLAVGAALFTVVVGAGMASASTSTSADVVASYNGGAIDLSQGWGTATVCAVTSTGTSCFTTQSEYLSWAGSQSQSSLAVGSPAISCSPGLELFQNISYGGKELILSTASNWINLSDYSFTDEVSSYKVGSCAVTMTDGPNGSGDIYPGATSPGSDVTWIGTAWNDRLQSVYLS
jgi:hypothetical protein